jgi:tetratricopeptide (TPR) repeat protein
VLGELVRVSERAGDLEVEADAVRRSVKLAPNDDVLTTRLAGLDDRLARLARKFTDLAGAAPLDEAELRAVVRTEVYARVGFHDRAERVLTAALAERPTSAALLAARAEALIAADRRADGLAVAATLARQVTGADAVAVRERIGLLGGEAGAAPAAAPAAPAVAPVAAVPAGTPVAAPAETAEARGDRLAAAGDLVGAVMAYREVLAANPQDTGILEKIAALRNARSAAAASPGCGDCGSGREKKSVYIDFTTAQMHEGFDI